MNLKKRETLQYYQTNLTARQFETFHLTKYPTTIQFLKRKKSKTITTKSHQNHEIFIPNISRNLQQFRHSLGKHEYRFSFINLLLPPKPRSTTNENLTESVRSTIQQTSRSPRIYALPSLSSRLEGRRSLLRRRHDIEISAGGNYTDP